MAHDDTHPDDPALDDAHLEEVAGGTGIIDWLKDLFSGDDEEPAEDDGFGGGSFGGGGAGGSW